MIGTKTFNITKQTITIDGSKIYDGNTSVAASDISTFNGLALTETLTINGIIIHTNSCATKNLYQYLI